VSELKQGGGTRCFKFLSCCWWDCDNDEVDDDDDCDDDDGGEKKKEEGSRSCLITLCVLFVPFALQLTRCSSEFTSSSFALFFFDVSTPMMLLIFAFFLLDGKAIHCRNRSSIIPEVRTRFAAARPDLAQHRRTASG